jgi:hypothetical protein
MSKGTRSVGRLAAMIAPMLAAVIAASCGGGTSGTTSTGSPTGTGTGGAGAGGAGGNNVGGNTVTSTSTGSSASTGVVDPSCVMDADCVNDPKGKVCDPQTGQCVACLPTNDVCPQSEYCDPATNTCKPGCSNDADCAAGGGVELHCDLTTNSCAGCLNDSDCPLGNICASNHTCTEGCSPMQGCAAGKTCCGTSCHDLANNDINNCGTCGNKCPVPANAVAVCVGSICGMGACDPAYANCNGSTNDGCEQNKLQEGPCACAPGTTQSCYQGGPGTVDVGACKAGAQTCNAGGTGWGPCALQVLPKPEICGNQIDDDCDGIVDNVSDADGDGWTTCNGDCCDSPGPGCPSPAQMNPGAFEVVGNGVDDDCDPSTSDTTPPTACAPAAKFAAVTSLDVAQAMDICQTTTANAPLPTKKWGLISSAQLLPNNAVPSAANLANIQNNQTAILDNYGSVIVPHKGPTMAGMSSGYMRDQLDPLPVGQSMFVPPNGGKAFSAQVPFTSPVPPSTSPLGFYLSKHAGGLPASVGCNPNGCPAGSGANDPASVQLKIRVPTNAKSFSYDFRFFSAEFQSFQCTTFNDFYLSILTSQSAGIPADHNISFDSLNNPLSVNNGFFQVCVPKAGTCGACPLGNSELALTGMQLNNTGGGTAWLTNDAPVVPGEIITLDLMIFDVSDHLLDSLVLLDNFRWSILSAVTGVHG